MMLSNAPVLAFANSEGWLTYAKEVLTQYIRTPSDELEMNMYPIPVSPVLDVIAIDATTVCIGCARNLHVMRIQEHKLVFVHTITLPACLTLRLGIAPDRSAYFVYADSFFSEIIPNDHLHQMSVVKHRPFLCRNYPPFEVIRSKDRYGLYFHEQGVSRGQMIWNATTKQFEPWKLEEGYRRAVTDTGVVTHEEGCMVIHDVATPIPRCCCVSDTAPIHSLVTAGKWVVMGTKTHTFFYEHRDFISMWETPCPLLAAACTHGDMLYVISSEGHLFIVDCTGTLVRQQCFLLPPGGAVKKCAAMEGVVWVEVFDGLKTVVYRVCV